MSIVYTFIGICELSLNYLSSNGDRVAGDKKDVTRNLEVRDLKGDDEEGDTEHSRSVGEEV